MVTVLKTTELAKPLNITDLTESKLDGTGVFDKFLTLHRIMLEREFKQGRIVGKEYSENFSKLYAVNLELSIRFLMEKEKQAYEIDLLNAQVRKMDNEALIALKQLELLTASLPYQIRLAAAQASKMEADVLIANKQLEIATKELLIKDRELEIMAQQLLLQAQKVITEKAQTDPSVIRPGSVIAANIKTLEAQILGMDRDAKTKVMQIMLGTWTTRANNDAADVLPSNHLTDNAIGQVVRDTLASADLTVGTP